MDAKRYPFVKYCNLGVITLRIFSEKDWDTKLVPILKDESLLNKEVVNLYIVSQDEPIFSTCLTYREKVMSTGYYIGHHFGNPAKIKWIDDGNIVISCDEPGRIIWSYIYKVVLTLCAHKKGLLHIKGSTIEYRGKAFIVLGRGGSGKTEFVTTLCKYGARLMGNTHALIDGTNAYGIRSNMRIRENNTERYASIDSQSNILYHGEWVPIGAIFWIKYRQDSAISIQKISKECAYQNFRWFAEAIANWEFKEDIADKFNSDPFLFAEFMKSTDNMIRKLSDCSSIYYVNLDIRSISGRNAITKLMDEIVDQISEVKKDD